MLLLTAATAARADDPSTNPPSAPVSQSVDQDGVHVTVKADRSRVRVADPLTVRFHVNAPVGTLVTFPPAEQAFGSFTVRETHDAFDIPSNGGRTWTRTQVLESYTAGAVDVPGVTIAYKTSQGGSEVTGEMTTPTLAIEVASTLPADADPLKFRDIKGEVAIAPPAGTPIWWWFAGGIAVMSVLTGVWWYRRSHRPLTAAERALADLSSLDLDEYIRGQRLQELYVAMTGIVRHYIERRFALRAPRQTTPEFLAGLCGEASLTLEHKRLLGEFLEAADLVKFACFAPAVDDVHAARAAAERFIRGTDAPVANDQDMKQRTQATMTSAGQDSRETCEVST